MKQIEKLQANEQVYENYYSRQVVTNPPTNTQLMNKLNEIIDVVNKLIDERPIKPLGRKSK